MTGKLLPEIIGQLMNGSSGSEFEAQDSCGRSFHEFVQRIFWPALTSKCAMRFDEMWAIVQSLLQLAFRRSRCGIAFNAMSSHVDWERDDLFHLPLETLAAFLCRRLSRHFVFRNDYGLYEFTTYVYHSPVSESPDAISPRQSD